MLPVLNRPVLELVVEHLRSHGVRQILIGTSYLGGEIENYFRDGSRFGVEIGYCFDGWIENGYLADASIGPAAAIRKIQDQSGFFDEPFVVSCGDVITDLDLTRFADLHRSSGALATLETFDSSGETPDNRGTVTAGPDGRVLEVHGTPARGPVAGAMANAGVYLFEPSIAGFIPDGVPYDIVDDLLPDLLRRDVPVYAAALPCRRFDAGTVTEYYTLLRQAMNGEVPGLTPPGAEIQPGLRVGPNVQVHPEACTIRGPVSIGASAIIEDGVSLLGPCYIGPGAVVQSGAVVDGSFVFEHTRVGANTHLKRSIANGCFCVTSDGVAVRVAESRLDWVLSDAGAQHQFIADPRQMLDALTRLADGQ